MAEDALMLSTNCNDVLIAFVQTGRVEVVCSSPVSLERELCSTLASLRWAIKGDSFTYVAATVGGVGCFCVVLGVEMVILSATLVQAVDWLVVGLIAAAILGVDGDVTGNALSNVSTLDDASSLIVVGGVEVVIGWRVIEAVKWD